IGRLHAERGLEQHPGAPVEELEEAAVKDDAGGIAMTPLNSEPPPADEFRHGGMIAAKRRGGQSRPRATKAPKNHDGRACARPSRSLRCYRQQGNHDPNRPLDATLVAAATPR